MEGPFLAIGTRPSNAAAPLFVMGDRVVADSAGAGMADVRQLQDLALLQASSGLLGERDGMPVYAPGLEAHAIGRAPYIGDADLGAGPVVIVHSDGEAVTPIGGRAPGYAAAPIR